MPAQWHSGALGIRLDIASINSRTHRITDCRDAVNEFCYVIQLLLVKQTSGFSK